MALSARYAKATDTFDSSISADWDNGFGDWGTLSWASGEVGPTADNTNSAMRRQTESFGANQYSKCVVGTLSYTGSSQIGWLASSVRMQNSATDESCYLGALTVNDLGYNKYLIEEVDAAFGDTSLAATGTAGTSLASGDYVILEVNGTGTNNLELYTKEGAGSETSVLTATDATITSGYPGIVAYSSDSATVTATSFEGGDDSVAISPSAGSLTITGSAPTVSVSSTGASFSITAGALTLAGVAPTVKTAQFISPSAGALTITGIAPTVSVVEPSFNVTVAAGALTLTGVAPTVKTAFGITPAAGTLAITGVAPTLKTAQTVSVAAGALTITGYAPTVKQGVSVSPAAGALAITGVAPSVTEQIKVTPDAGTLVIAGAAPGVFVGAPGEFAPAAAVLTLTGVAPTVTQQVGISPAAGTLTLEGAAPSVRTDTLITVEPAELTVAGYAPVVAVPLNFMVEPAQIVLTGVAPTVAGGEAMPAEGMTHAGAKRRRRKRYLVEIDGQDFEVSSVEEAQELLARAEEVAQEQARVAVERSANASRRQRRKVVADARKALSLPQVRVAGSESDQVAAQIERQARLFVDRVSDLYREAMQAVEIGALLRRVAAEEEEDAIVVMLMHL